MKKTGKLIIVNILVFIALMILFDFIAALSLDGYNFIKKHKTNTNSDNRAYLPNYKNVLWAKRHFKEFSELRAEYHSYYGWRMKPYSGQTINIDSNGLRRTIQSPATTEKSPLAVFLGGSTVWGTGVNDSLTIPSLFAQDTNVLYRVLNYGISAYSAYQSYIFFQIRTIKNEVPELVISYDGVNNSPVYLQDFFTHTRENQIKERMKGADDYENIYKPYLFAATKEFIFRIKRRFRKKLPVDIPGFTEGRNIQAAVELLESWLLTKEYCDNIGAKFICILQPNTFVGHPDIDNLSASIKQSRYKNGFKYYKYVTELINTSRYECLKDNFLNYSNALNNMPDTYIDFCHVSPAGNKKIVNLLVKDVNNMK